MHLNTHAFKAFSEKCCRGKLSYHLYQ